jgi:hypothetical protein
VRLTQSVVEQEDGCGHVLVEVVQSSGFLGAGSIGTRIKAGSIDAAALPQVTADDDSQLVLVCLFSVSVCGLHCLLCCLVV